MDILGILAGLALIAGLLGLAGAVGIFVAMAWGLRRGYYALTGKQYVPLLKAGSEPEYQHQDIDDGSTADSIRSVFKRNLSAKGVNVYARAGLTALDSCERKCANFLSVLGNKFQSGSITWQKFAGAADATKQAVLRNCAKLANAIQVFDHEDFRASERIRRRTTYRTDSTVNVETQIEKQHLFQAQLEDMQAIVDLNDKLLLELDKLTTEINTLDDSGSSAESDKLIAEIRSLSAETKYYRDALDQMD